jgi:thiosulfate/3-mercaptopyruvate sulfurtransferase
MTNLRAFRRVIFAAVLSAVLIVATAGVWATSAEVRQSSAAGKSSLLAAPAATVPAGAQAKPAETPLSGEMLIEPDDVAKAIQSSKPGKPLLIHVGFHILYTQAHVPDSQYLGPASSDEGMQQLRKGMQSVPRNKFIVLYCGCCPWTHCPNIKPAYEALHAMGFTKVKVLHIDDNLGTNWVNKGFPVAKGD